MSENNEANDRLDMHRPAAILKYLLQGNKLQVGSETYALSDDNRLCLRAVDQDGNEHWLAVNFGDFALQDFISFCQKKVSEEDFISMCGAAALRGIMADRRK